MPATGFERISDSLNRFCIKIFDPFLGSSGPPIGFNEQEIDIGPLFQNHLLIVLVNRELFESIKFFFIRQVHGLTD